MTQVNEPILRLSGVSKRFPGVLAVDGISLDVAPGEMLALAGENGAGKSSLIRLLAGIHRPDSGEMRLAGQIYAPQTPLDAIRAGVRVVHQEFNLLPALSVAENLLFEHLPRRRLGPIGGIVDRREMDRRAEALLARVGLDEVGPRTPVERLGIAQKQLVEIARALSGDLSSGGRVLVLDEPTATLTPREAGRLFEQIRLLKASGMTMLYVSHHLAEIFALCDRVAVLRNGALVDTMRTADTEPAALVGSMIGRTLATQAPIGGGTPGAPALSVRGLRPRGSPEDGALDFAVREGEIVGLAGLVGAGRTEAVRAIFGADPAIAGTIERDGKPVRIRSPRDAVDAGICLLTENRKEEGLVLPMAARVNTTLARLKLVSRFGWLRPAAERAETRRLAKDLATKITGPEQPVIELSGGNQQKIVLAKWLMGDKARVLMLDEPTRGIDVGAKAEIYALLGQLAQEGRAILVVSSELPELTHLCDRILVLSRGVLAGEVARPDFSEERILSLAYSRYTQAHWQTH
ncbi:sugar ABC transporter ATP-binding protein [Acetobacteraceae bacterium KSS8]|uniref:Sugar ABC transporter ATP-binding protein n=1 Tax=Endosaccharibacter trunci TaxID=2812733 RepID=A0ABT1W5Y0_9PROT|nr:sugar ABC transporter ATP-binding protein [Acetobacteraceae bacterium KSS8]